MRRRRHLRIRRKVAGTAERPRLAVHRSLKHVIGQIIDDTRGMTLVGVSSSEPGLAAAAAHVAPAQGSGPSTPEAETAPAAEGTEPASAKSGGKGEGKAGGKAAKKKAQPGDKPDKKRAGGGAPRPEGAKAARARAAGRTLAERARAKGIQRVVFDRGGYVFHGRVRAFAEGAREGGLEF
jgi:ribosomal protein L18